MKQTKTLTFTVRATPEQIRSASELARKRGIGRSRLVLKLLERELAGAGEPEQPAKGESADARAN